MSKTSGMSPGMLRARRRDACVKPNRVLDKSSSRCMIYENEELRLRTININAEIERGQSELKKLKRENDHLRREIWALRDEVDRLEALLKQKEQEEEEEEEGESEDELEAEDEAEDEGGGGFPEPHKFLRLPRIVEPDGLSVVPEESEEPSTPEPPANHQACLNPERRLEEYKGALPPCIRLNCVHPYTTATTLRPSLANITTMEVIEECGRAARGLVGVRLLEDRLYLSWRGRPELEAAVSQGILIRREHLQLHDVSQGTVVLAMSAIPHAVKEQDLLKLLSQFGPVIGGVERRMYRGADTGEGLVRLRPLASLPKRLYLEGAEIAVRPLCHEELSKLSMEQHQVRSRVPSSLNIRADKEELKASDSAKSSSGNPSKSEPFVFPVPSTSTSTQSTPKMEERSQSAPVGVLRTPESGSAQSLRPHSDGEVKRPAKRVGSKRGKSPSSSSEQDSPAKPPRRRASFVPPVDRERSNSLSSRASYTRRKMSMTGRETGKLPWCACWGNGCY